MRLLLATLAAAATLSGCAALPITPEQVAQRCEQQVDMRSWTPDCNNWRMQRDLKAAQQRQAEDAAREAQIQSERQAAWQREQQQAQKASLQKAQALIDENQRLGYKTITFDDLALDGKALEGKKVAIYGTYVDEGPYLFRDAKTYATFRATYQAVRGSYIPLYAEQASRDARATLLRCANAPLGCPMMIRGKVATLSMGNAMGAKWEELGIQIESANP